MSPEPCTLHQVNAKTTVLTLLDYDPGVWGVPPESVGTVLYQVEGYVDSLQIMSFIIALEDSFNIELPTEVTESDEFTSVGGVIAIVERLSARTDGALG